MSTNELFPAVKQHFSLETEEALIGCILISPEKFAEITTGVSPDDFYNSIYKTVYKTALEMYMRSDDGFDVIQLLTRLNAVYSGDEARELKKILERAMNSVPSVHTAPTYAAIIRNLSIARRAERIALDFASDIVSETASEQTLKAAEELIALTKSSAKQKLVSIGELIIPSYESFFNKSGLNLLNTGFTKFDKCLGGIEKSDLMIIAARPGTGKTAFTLNLIVSMMKQKKKIAFFTLEMKYEQVVRRLFSMKSQAPMSELKQHNGESFTGQLSGAADWFTRYEEYLFLYDRSGLTVREIRSLCFLKSDLDVIVIDYLGFMKPSKFYKDRNDAIGEITSDLKALAKDLDVPVICLSQLNRAVEGRSDNRPNLSDLRDSGSIEQDANQIVFLFLEDKKSPKTSNIGVYIAKNRDGEQGFALMGFDRSTQTFFEIERNYSPAENQQNNKKQLQFEL